MLLGSQEPRITVGPLGAVESDADDAVDLAAGYGLVADDWQESEVLGGWLARGSNGKWAASRCGLSVPRQNGKNGALEIRELFGMVMLGEKFLHTAHEVKTARKAFRRLLSFFENERRYPELAALVVEIRKTNGQEAIVLNNGGSVEFVARSKGSGRGFTVDVLVCDEAQDMSDDDLAALLPTISAAPLGNPQIILTGTPPTPRMTGEVFGRMRAEALAGGAKRLCWREWSVERPKKTDPPLDLDSKAVWALANPGLGIRLLFDTIEDERASMDEETFARERLGMWDDLAAIGAVIDPASWADLTEQGSEPEMLAAFGVDITPDRAWADIGLAGQREDGRWHLEIVEHRPGMAWVVDRCVELNDAHGPLPFVLDASGPAGTLVKELEAAGLEVIELPARELARACVWLVDHVEDGSIVHGPDEVLADAVLGVRKKDAGDGLFRFNRATSTVYISPIMAVTVAAHALIDLLPLDDVAAALM